MRTLYFIRLRDQLLTSSRLSISFYRRNVRFLLFRAKFHFLLLNRLKFPYKTIISSNKIFSLFHKKKRSLKKEIFQQILSTNKKFFNHISRGVKFFKTHLSPFVTKIIRGLSHFKIYYQPLTIKIERPSHKNSWCSATINTQVVAVGIQIQGNNPRGSFCRTADFLQVKSSCWHSVVGCVTSCPTVPARGTTRVTFVENTTLGPRRMIYTR